MIRLAARSLLRRSPSRYQPSFSFLNVVAPTENSSREVSSSATAISSNNRTNGSKNQKSKDERNNTAKTSSTRPTNRDWSTFIHPYQDPSWTGKQDPSEYLSFMENSLQQFRQRRRKRDLLLLRQAEKILWEVEMMHRAYQNYSASAENDPSSASHGVAEAVRRFNQYRQEALYARYELMRLRRRHIRGHNHYKFVMQHFPIPEALVEEEETRTSNKPMNGI